MCQETVEFLHKGERVLGSYNYPAFLFLSFSRDDVIVCSSSRLSRRPVLILLTGTPWLKKYLSLGSDSLFYISQLCLTFQILIKSNMMTHCRTQRRPWLMLTDLKQFNQSMKTLMCEGRYIISFCSVCQ